VVVPSLKEFVEEDSGRVMGDGRCCFVEMGVFGTGNSAFAGFSADFSSREDLLGFFASSGFPSSTVPAYHQLS